MALLSQFSARGFTFDTYGLAYRGERRRAMGVTMGPVLKSFIFPVTSEKPLTDPTKKIAGRVLGTDGNPYPDGALVVLYRSEDDAPVASQISSASGTYSFPRNSYDTRQFYVAAYTREGTPLQAVTPRTLVPTT